MGDRSASTSLPVSSAKNKRLHALHQRLGSKRASSAQRAGDLSDGLPNKKPKPSTAVAPPASNKQFPYEPLDHVRFSSAIARRLQEPAAAANQDAAAAFLSGLLTSTAAEGTSMQSMKQRVQDRVLQLDNPAAVNAAKAQRQLQRKRNSPAQRAGSAPRMRAHAKQLSRLPVNQQRYELYQPLTVLWQTYAAKLLQSPNLADDLLQTDLRGCQLTVLASKVQRHVGKQGVVVQDRSSVLSVITPDNQQLLLAKRGGKFRVQLDALHSIVLIGDAMAAG